jgi:hypothetical protein
MVNLPVCVRLPSEAHNPEFDVIFNDARRRVDNSDTQDQSRLLYVEYKSQKMESVENNIRIMEFCLFMKKYGRLLKVRGYFEESPTLHRMEDYWTGFLKV